ncbi:MAG: recombination regulator RecX [Ruminococcus sp.]|jgi:regulatory protein|nr:recombination regulator RecX [Ruminococcus sp.]
MHEEIKKAYTYATNLLEIKSYSVAKLRDKILSRYSSDAADEVINRLITEGYLNDRKFARHAAEYMAEVKKFGAYRIKKELFVKGIAKDLIEEVMADIETDDVDNIIARIKKKYSGNLETPAGEQKIITAMTRYGFKYSDIIKAIKRMKEELITL